MFRENVEFASDQIVHISENKVLANNSEFTVIHYNDINTSSVYSQLAYPLGLHMFGLRPSLRDSRWANT